MWTIEKIILNKFGSKGDASVYFEDEDGDTVLVLNKFLIDITDGAAPVDIVRYSSTPLFSGAVIEKLKLLILEVFETIQEENIEIGIFEFDGDEVRNIGE